MYIESLRDTQRALSLSFRDLNQSEHDRIRSILDGAAKHHELVYTPATSNGNEIHSYYRKGNLFRAAQEMYYEWKPGENKGRLDLKLPDKARDVVRAIMRLSPTMDSHVEFAIRDLYGPVKKTTRVHRR